MPQRLTNKQIIGQKAEQLACSFLRQQGLVLLARNFHCRCGELDLIMQHQETIVFVEVRYRYSEQYGGSLASITPAKQRKLLKAAKYFLQKQFGTDQVACQFDIVAVASNHDGQLIVAEWIKNALC